MSSDLQNALPKKKRSVYWWMGGVLLVLLSLFFYQLFGPNPKIIVSKQTTYVTAPLGADSLPDYKRHILQQLRARVTPENNAAVPLWQTLGADELQPGQYALLAAELHLREDQSSETALRKVYCDENYARVIGWLRTGNSTFSKQITTERNNQSAQAREDSSSEESSVLHDMAEDVIDQATSCPWRTEQILPLADWIQENEQPLDLIITASTRTQFYSPPASLLNDNDDLVLTLRPPTSDSFKETSRSLPARAMWHTGEGRPLDAWKDLFAIHRIAHLMASQGWLDDHLVGAAMTGIACKSTLTVLDQGRLTTEQARQIQHDVDSLSDFDFVTRDFDQSERISMLDSWMRVAANGGFIPDVPFYDDAVNLGSPNLRYTSTDWNVILSDTNEWFDKLVAAAKLPTAAQRTAEFARIQADALEISTRSESFAGRLGSTMSRAQRSRFASNAMICQFVPGIVSANIMQDRANVNLQLLRTAAALAVYRAEHQSYPNKLADLVSDSLQRVPLDLYTGQPLIYRRTTDGYLLYSAGENGRDNGGSNEWGVFEGTWLDDSTNSNPSTQIPAGADDIAIRVPTPQLKLRNVPTQSKAP